MPGEPSSAGAFAMRRFEEASEQERSLPGFAQHYSQLSPGRFEGSISSLSLPGFSILRERINVSVVQAFTAPKDRVVSFCLPSHAGGFHSNGEGQVGGSLGVGHGWSRLGVSEENSDIIMVVADIAVFDEDARPEAGAVRTGPSTASADALFDWLASLLAVYASGEAARSPGLDLLIADLLRDRLGALSASLSGSSADRPRIDRRAHALHGEMQDWLATHPREPATVASLSRALGASSAELRRASLAVLGTALDALLLTRRLDLARRDIIEARRTSRRICDIALDWGFSHWGRFSGTYRDFFGETPSRTLRGG
ncbi:MULTISPECIES: helix-turn-helix domain-containing protein [unclassified Aureimonas]|uniref:helix-turn-helix domain-containing protein n=1 Tax=unclassified Aureimonas TaxID=2615206 RepID=UPI0006FD103E|nr:MULTISPECIES: helix-turn-helix domain-containing protein [unclassified Aureimonas]KQT64047.1 hypothetical protein ASG62_03255 [Aureimonas sp. Leaf427]KQT81239.1 hypothetical protein ASG54_00525 [Aureimonas sp. Leaf460]